MTETSQTNQQYARVIAKCREVFAQKARDYGPAWLILRMPSVTDQIYIKAERIRSIQQTGQNRVGDPVSVEFMAIVNYCIIAGLLLRSASDENLPRHWSADPEALLAAYDSVADHAFRTMTDKNHDYGEAWRKMRVSSMTDLILMKIHRIKQIEDNNGQVFVSEGAESNYVDVLNYAVFCLIRLEEQADKEG